MKFGQSLEDHLVPEWRAQYLDYKGGKKKLKKLKKKKNSQGSGSSSPFISSIRSRVGSMTSRFNDNDLQKVKTGNSQLQNQLSAVNEEDNENGDDQESEDRNFAENNLSTDSLQKFKVKMSKNSIFEENDPFNSDVNSKMSSSSTFILPDSAMKLNKDDYGTVDPFSENNKVTINDQNKENDQTPLLNYITPTSTLVKNSSNNLRRVSAASRLETPQSVKRRSSIASLMDTFKRSPSYSNNSNPDTTELEDLAVYAKEQFVNWVDSELDKVQLFYKNRENACVERFLILEDQIIQLEYQKQESKKKWLYAKRMLNSNGNNESGSGTSANFGSDDGIDFDEMEDYDDDENGYEEYMDSDLLANYNNGVFGIAQRNFKLLSFWTRRKLRIVNKFDMPSLPTFEWLKKNGKVEKQYYEEGYYSDDDGNGESDDNIPSNAHIRDFQRRKRLEDNHVPYFVARKMIKKSVHELYRSMELLKSYRVMNRIAFRKLIKKYDKSTGDSLLPSYMKKLDQTYFSQSEILDTLMTNVEELYTRYFENGSRKVAVTKLRTSAVEKTFYVADYFSGLFFGLAIPLVIYAMYLGLHKNISGELPNGKYLLQIWGGFFIIVSMGLLFAINCFVWTKFKVNYKFIFEFNQHDALDFKEYMVLPSLFLFFGGLIAWFSFEDFWPKHFSGYDMPWLFLGICMTILLCPFDIFYLNARLWLISTTTRLILSGFYPVEFRDFFLGDIFCSLTYSLSNISMFLCIYSKYWNDCSSCGSSESRVLGFLNCVPSIWRFLQCFRRYADTGDWFPHLANMMKYSVSTLYYVSLSLYRIETIRKYRILLIVWATANSVVSSVWDILMDWSLFQFDSKYFLLRDEITFKYPIVYYNAMIIDVILRFQWIFYALFPKQIQQSAITSFLVAVAEIVRRFIWIFFRMENEHATNVHLFRASRESPLPYPINKKMIAKQSNNLLNGQDLSEDITEQAMENIDAKGDIETGIRGNIGVTRNVSRSMSTPDISKMYNRVDEPNSLPYGYEENGAYNNNSGSGITSSVTRYFQGLSRTLRSAHIKDFQRRKPTTEQQMAAAEEES